MAESDLSTEEGRNLLRSISIGLVLIKGPITEGNQMPARRSRIRAWAGLEGPKVRHMTARAGASPRVQARVMSAHNHSSPERARQNGPYAALTGLESFRYVGPGPALADSLQPRLSHHGLSARKTADPGELNSIGRIGPFPELTPPILGSTLAI